MNRKLFLAAVISCFIFMLPVGSHSQDAILIISADDFIEQVKPLARFKTYSGRPTFLLSLSQVYSAFAGADEPEQIKRCIAHYEANNNVNYVILVGDVDSLPVRHRSWGWEGQIGWWGATDLYYADLYKNGTTTFDTWDANGNGLYAETEFSAVRAINNDSIDILPDVALGRIPASRIEEVRAYVEKLILYELKTTPTAPWFKRGALYTGTWLEGAYDKSQAIGTHLMNRGWSLTKRYSSWSPNFPPQGIWTPPPPDPGDADVAASMTDDMNLGVGFVSYHGHGSPTNWSCLGFDRNRVSQLANRDMLPVIFAAACDTGMLAWAAADSHYYDLAGVAHCGRLNGEALPPGPYPYTALPRPDTIQFGPSIACPGGSLCEVCNVDPHTIAESFLFGNPPGRNGAIAYLGWASTGQSGSLDLVHDFFLAYSTESAVLGDLWRSMIESYYNIYTLKDSDTWFFPPENGDEWVQGHKFTEPLKVQLYGDPSLNVGGAFTQTRGGEVFDGAGGPWLSYERFRITQDMTVPYGKTLHVLAASSAFVEPGRKITAFGDLPDRGFLVDASVEYPASLSAINQDAQGNEIISFLKMTGQLRLRNGGQIKMF